MERKSIGSFIAALRKANGFTQKELAEKLNVSDKAVSRWERDECAPDLSLIPVIAEVFDVTADELLCGERRPTEATDIKEKRTARTEKQMQRFLDAAFVRLRNFSIIPIAFALSAILFTLLIPSHYVALSTGITLVIISVICEIIFLANAFFSTDAEDFQAEKLNKFRKKSVDFSKIVFSLSFYALYFNLAIKGFLGFCTGTEYYNSIYEQLRELFTNPEHNIFSLDVLFIILLYAIFAYLLFKTVWSITLVVLTKRNIYPSGGQPKTMAKRKMLFFVIVSLVLSLTLLCEINFYSSGFMRDVHFVEGQTFNDAKSFSEYAGKEEGDLYSSSSVSGLSLLSCIPVDVYEESYDETATMDEIVEKFVDEKSGETVEFVVRNNNISQYYPAENGIFPITVYTTEQVLQNQVIYRTLCVMILTIELIAAGVVYFLLFKKTKV